MIETRLTWTTLIWKDLPTNRFLWFGSCFMPIGICIWRISMVGLPHTWGLLARKTLHIQSTLESRRLEPVPKSFNQVIRRSLNQLDRHTPYFRRPRCSHRHPPRRRRASQRRPLGICPLCARYLGSRKTLQLCAEDLAMQTPTSCLLPMQQDATPVEPLSITNSKESATSATPRD